MGWSSRISELLSAEDCLPAVGQGVLAIETRVDDPDVLPLVARLDDAATRACVTAERKFLDVVQGGCQAPIGVYARFDEAKLVLKARILSLDSARCVEGASVGETEDAAKMGQELAERLLNEGARQILAEIGLG